MKKKLVWIFVLTISLPGVSLALTSLTVNGDFDSGADGWGYESAWGSYFYDDNGDTIVSMGGWGDGWGNFWTSTSIWQDTGTTFAADTKYVLSVTWRDPDAVDIESIMLVIQDVTTGYQDIAYDWYSTNVGGEWVQSTLIFNTADNPSVVGDTIGVNLRLTSSYGTWLHVDNVQLYALQASDPYPTDGQLNYGNVYDDTTVEAMLSWSAMADPNSLTSPYASVTDHYLFIQESDPNITKTVPDYTISAGTPVQEYADITLYLDYNKTYYWRVDESIDGSTPTDSNTVSGAVWSFSTLPFLPLITVDLTADKLVVPGNDAQFTVTATSSTTLHYQWYHTTDNTAEPLADTQVGSDSPTLILEDIQVNDIGYYYCVVSNISGSVTSNIARLEIERLIGHWKLDSTLTDISGNGLDGVGANAETMIYDAGIDGQAVTTNDTKYVIITDSNEVFNFYNTGLTVSAWVKTDTAEWSGIVSKLLRVDPHAGWLLGTTWQGQPYFDIRPILGTGESPKNVTDNQWHMVTGTYDAAEGIAYLYVDGLLSVQSEPYLEASNFTRPDKPVVIGAEQNDGVAPFTGLVDDVRIYTYPLSSLEIANLYVAFEPAAKICLDNVIPAGDINEDCIVDIKDFAIIAENWLTCNIVPDCIN